MSIVTLTTDFGTRDSYVAQMKGAIFAINPAAQLVDVTHDIPPQAVSRAAVVVDEIARVYPPGSIHLAVVDPGVGSGRALLAAEAAGQRFVAPDNGLLSVLFRRCPPSRVHQLTVDRFWRKPVSATFHGRDILGPVAAHWSRGADIVEFGPPVSSVEIVLLALDEPQREGQVLIGRVEAVDVFGNLLTNIRETDLHSGDGGCLLISIGPTTIAGISQCYSDAPGRLLALIGSSGRLEIAVSNGNAERVLKVSVGAEVRVETRDSSCCATSVASTGPSPHTQ